MRHVHFFSPQVIVPCFAFFTAAKMYYRVFKEVYMRENKPFLFSQRNLDLDYRKQKHVFPHSS